MSRTRWKCALALLAAVTVLGTGAGLALRPTTAAPEEQTTTRPSAKPPNPEAEGARGRLDPQGDPLPDGAVGRLGSLRFRHEGGVQAACFAPDGRTVASSGGKTIRLWDPATGKERLRLTGADEPIRCLAYSPDSRLLAAGCEDGVLRLWDPVAGKELRKWNAHPAGRFPEPGGVRHVAFTPTGESLLTCGSDKPVRLWEAATGKEIRTFEVPGGPVASFALSPDGKVLAATATDKRQVVHLLDTATGKAFRSFEHPRDVVPLAFAPDGKTLAVGFGELRQPGEVRLWDVASGKLVGSLTGHEGWVLSLAFAPDGKSLATGGYDKTLRVWDVASLKETKRILHSDVPVYHVGYAPDGKAVASWGWQHTLRLWDPGTGKELHPGGGPQMSVVSVAFSPDGKLLASAAASDILLWDVPDRKQLRALRGHEGNVTAVVFAADGKTLASASYDGTLRLWEVATGKELRQIPAGGRWVACLALSTDNDTLASWNTENSAAITLWSAATGKELRSLALPVQPMAAIHSLSFAPDGKTLAAASGTDLAVRLWEVSSGKELRGTGKHPGGLTWAAFSPDGRSLASASLDHTLHLWEAATGQSRFLVKLKTHITTLAFSPDGRVLATANNGRNRRGGADGRSLDVGNEDRDEVRLWDVLTGREVRRLTGHQGSVCALAFSPDGKLLATGSSDTTTLLWDATAFRAELPPADLTPRDLDALWADLSGNDASRAYQAMARLAAAPKQALPLLKEKLPVVVAADPQRTARLLAALGSDQFAERDKASEELEKLGATAEPALRKALKETPSLEVRKRVERVLEKLEGESRLGAQRALEVLERLGTPEARKLLEALADGAPDAWLTREARSARGRLDNP
jgi:WD40 repeat protein